MINLTEQQIAIDTVRSLHDEGTADILQKGLDELVQWRENVECMLEDLRHTIRARPGGGPEDLIMSLVLTVMKMEKIILK